MSAFYYHGDMHDVAALRIRTPKFETHEDADLHYYRKRLDRQVARERWRFIYSGLLIISFGVGLYKWHVGPHPVMWTHMLLYMASGAMAAALAIALCSRAMAWMWEDWDADFEEEKEGAKEDSAV